MSFLHEHIQKLFGLKKQHRHKKLHSQILLSCNIIEIVNRQIAQACSDTLGLK